jgi:hypothetical protein
MDKCCVGEHVLTDDKASAEALVAEAQPMLLPVAEAEPQGD